LSGPKPGVDYDALVTEAPKLTAKNEHIDRTLFQAASLVFGMLIDTKPDKDGHASRLVITRAERVDLLKSLQAGFGKKMDKKGDQGYFVASGTVLRDLLSKQGYRCADELLLTEAHAADQHCVPPRQPPGTGSSLTTWAIPKDCPLTKEQREFKMRCQNTPAGNRGRACWAYGLQ
jgi:hypothetical protein